MFGLFVIVHFDLTNAEILRILALKLMNNHDWLPSTVVFARCLSLFLILSVYLFMMRVNAAVYKLINPSRRRLSLLSYHYMCMPLVIHSLTMFRVPLTIGHKYFIAHLFLVYSLYVSFDFTSSKTDLNCCL